jgi:hypothetical protein
LAISNGNRIGTNTAGVVDDARTGCNSLVRPIADVLAILEILLAGREGLRSRHYGRNQNNSEE